MAWDRDLWNAIDCETDRRNEFEFSAAHFIEDEDLDENLMVTVNCTCQTGRIFAVVEESIADGRDYLESRTESIVFSICSAVSLAMLLIANVCLTCLNASQKTSIRVHRNIAFCVLMIHVRKLIIQLDTILLSEQKPPKLFCHLISALFFSDRKMQKCIFIL